MKICFFIALFAAISFTACRNQKEVAQGTTISAPADVRPATPIVEQSQMEGSTAENRIIDSLRSPKYRFIVSFYSIGEGRDEPSRMKFLTYLDNFKKENNQTIIAEEFPWGREGEVDYCMKLNEIGNAEQAIFIQNLKATLAGAKWVHFIENAPNRHGH